MNTNYVLAKYASVRKRVIKLFIQFRGYLKYNRMVPIMVSVPEYDVQKTKHIIILLFIVVQ